MSAAPLKSSTRLRQLLSSPDLIVSTSSKLASDRILKRGWSKGRSW